VLPNDAIDRLQSIPEALKTLNDLATSISALVGPPELQVHQQSNDNNETSSDHAGSDTGDIMRRILSTEDSSTDDTTDSTSSDKGSRAQSALPLATDVVRLPCQDAGDVGVGSSSGEENTEVADTDVVGEPDHGQTDEGKDTVGDNPNTAYVILMKS
jgi:hypothetical protein